ncbi:MAG: hypothetical protein JRH18_19085 [Deltaproteobacteria bacterium]|nr:hypothetical protein [Deltaproteobacteria bacterium]MBW2153759.1 hypothetical protein [Deltaproteobacteria bacterium]
MKKRFAKKWTILCVLALTVSLVALQAQPGLAKTPADTLVVAYHRAPNNFMPGKTSSLPNIWIGMLMYDSLVIHDSQGKVHPGLAKRWDVSKDGTLWTFYLRDNVTFHSGRKFTAKDVKAHFDMWQKEFPTKAKIKSLESTTIIDDYTVQFKLKYPNLVFLNMISQTEWGYSGIPDSVAVEKYGDDYGILPESISGTGPFMIKKWVRGEQVVLERNPNYTWGPAFYENTGPPHLKRVIIRTMPEEASRSAALERGEIDMDISMSPKDAPRLSKKKGLNVIIKPKNTIHHLGFNHKKEIWKDLKLRRALMFAIDQKAIVEMAYNGYAEPSIGLWGPGVEGHTPKDIMAKIAPSYDPEKAKKLLDEAGWKMGPKGGRVKNGKPLSFTVYIYTEQQANIMTVVQEQWRQIGADPQIRQMEYAAWQKAMRAGEHDMRYVNGTHSTADIAYWFICESIPYPNHLFWCDEKTDRLQRVTVTTTNPEERIRAFQEMEQDFMNRAVLIPMPHSTWLVGAWDYVKDLKLHPIHGMYKLMDAKKVYK